MTKEEKIARIRIAHLYKLPRPFAPCLYRTVNYLILGRQNIKINKAKFLNTRPNKELYLKALKDK